MNPNYYNLPPNRPPIPPVSINNQANNQQFNQRPLMTTNSQMSVPSISYPVTAQFPYNNYPLTNQLPFYASQTPQQFYMNSYYSQPKMVNYPPPLPVPGYLSCYPPPLPNSTMTNINSSINSSITKPAQPPDPIKPPPPPADKIPMPPASSETNLTNSKIGLQLRAVTTSKNNVNEYGSFLNKFSAILPNLSKNSSCNSSNNSTNINSDVQKSDLTKSQLRSNFVDTTLNQLYSDTQSNISTSDKPSDKTDEMPKNYLYSNQNSHTSFDDHTKQQIESFNNDKKSHYNRQQFLSQQTKRQKLNIEDFDENRVKNQLNQVNQLKQQQFKISNDTTNNSTNNLQTLFTAADECWLRKLNPEQQKLIELIKEQRKNFEDIYNQWEEDYKEWRTKNITLLDYDTYQKNLKEWEEWRSSLIERKIKLNKTSQQKIDLLKRQIMGEEPVSKIVDLNAKTNEKNDANFQLDNQVSKQFDDLDEFDAEQNCSDSLDPPESQFNNQTALFPASLTIMQQKEQEEEKRKRMENASEFFNYIDRIKNVLNTINRLDFKVKQDRIKYNHQLESIKKTIEKQSHSDSDDDNSNNLNDSFSGHIDSSSVGDSNKSLVCHQPDNARNFDINSILNRLQQVKSPVLSSVERSSTARYTDVQLPIEKASNTSNELFHHPMNQLTDNRSLIKQQSPVKNPIRTTSTIMPAASTPKTTLDSDFLCKLGIDLSSSNKVLSYKDSDYWLRPPSFILNAEDLFELPAREYRPKRICLIIRGHPNSVKSDFIELACKTEMRHHARFPKIFNFKDYLIQQKKLSELYSTEQEFVAQCKKVLFDDFSRIVKTGQYDFIICNSINQKISDFEHFYIIAKVNNYSTYIIEMDFIDYADIPNNFTGDLNFDEWNELSRNWELTPASYIKLKINYFITNDKSNTLLDNSPLDRYRSSDNNPVASTSDKIAEQENDNVEDNLESEKQRFFCKINLEDSLAYHKLDDFRMRLKRPEEEYWAIPTDYYQRKYSREKRVRWLDIERRGENN